MCEFFSFSSDGKGMFYYFTTKDIKKINKNNNPNKFNFNSHASIAVYYNFNEDKFNKYEYNPFIKEFKIDQLNTKDDSDKAKSWVNDLFEKMNRKEFLKFYSFYRKKTDYQKLESDLGNIPTQKNVIKLIKEIDKIEWFKPQKEPNKIKLKLKVDSILKAFKLDFSCNIQLNPLNKKEDWDSARDSARDSAWRDDMENWYWQKWETMGSL